MADLFYSLVGRTRLRIICCLVLNFILSPLEVMSDVVSCIFVGPVVPDKPVKSGDPRLNRSREIPPEATRGGIFDGFFAVASDRK